MKKKYKKPTSVSLSTAEDVRNQIENGGERIWRLTDFVVTASSGQLKNYEGKQVGVFALFASF